MKELDKYAKWPQWAEPTLSFLSGKQLLMVPGVEARASTKVKIAAAIKVGLELEPRVIEVLPAAIIHFPRSFLDLDAMPDKLREVVGLIRNGASTGPALAGIAYKAMQRWAEMPLADKRSKPVSEQRLMKSFRLRKSVIFKLQHLAKERKSSVTEALESLIEGQNLRKS